MNRVNNDERIKHHRKKIKNSKRRTKLSGEKTHLRRYRRNRNAFPTTLSYFVSDQRTNVNRHFYTTALRRWRRRGRRQRRWRRMWFHREIPTSSTSKSVKIREVGRVNVVIESRFRLLHWRIRFLGRRQSEEEALLFTALYLWFGVYEVSLYFHFCPQRNFNFTFLPSTSASSSIDLILYYYPLVRVYWNRNQIYYSDLSTTLIFILKCCWKILF